MAVGRSLPISTKQSIEICDFIRNRSIDDAKKILNEVIKKKMAIPFKRFREGAGHKRGIASGKYPQKACKELLKVLNMVEANAQHKGLSSSLKIKSILAQKASTPWHFGRKRRRKMKRTHIEVVVEEIRSEGKKRDARKERAIGGKKESGRQLEKKEGSKEAKEPKNILIKEKTEERENKNLER